MRGILIISLVFNLLVAAALLAVLERKGGWGYVRAKYYELTTESPYTDPAQPFYESTEYRREVSIHNQHPIQRGDVVFAGDSHVAMGAWPEAYPSLRVHNRGISGDTVEGLRRRIDSLVIDSPAALFISIGSNDVDARYQGRSVKEVAQDVKTPRRESARSVAGDPCGPLERAAQSAHDATPCHRVAPGERAECTLRRACTRAGRALHRHRFTAPGS